MDDAAGGDAQLERAGFLGGHTRRELLQYGAGVTAAVVLTGYDSRAFGAPNHPASAFVHTFSESEAETLEAILERMIPSGESGDGAKEAGVLRYIDRALAGDYSDLAGKYRVKLKAVDEYARQHFGKSFIGLAGTDADAVITAIEEGTAPGFTPDAMTFFAMLRAHYRGYVRRPLLRRQPGVRRLEADPIPLAGVRCACVPPRVGHHGWMAAPRAGCTEVQPGDPDLSA